MPDLLKTALPDTIDLLNKEQQGCMDALSELFDGAAAYLFMPRKTLTPRIVGDYYEDLRAKYGERNDKLVVLVDSGGGDIHTAFNLDKLFRRYGEEQLIFVVPRWAKSAATLMVCGGDRILMSPVAELGPIDPQITQYNELEQRLETFSPLHLESTLDLIREEFRAGEDRLAEALTKRLQFPLTLGSIRKSLDVGSKYLEMLLSTRMLKDSDEAPECVTEACNKLTEGYSDHGFCIDCDEAQRLGLLAEELQGEALETVWRIYLLHNKRLDVRKKEKSKEMEERIKKLPPELLKQLPDLDQLLRPDDEESESSKGGY